jgi:signal transduction histidine kinase
VARPRSLLFATILLLSLALVVWWTSFQVGASSELAAAGERLEAGDATGAARALGAAEPADLAELAHRRRTMFASEGAFFAFVLIGLGWLYLASERRERRSRADHDRFLAATTHELKTPLTTVALLLESLRDDRLPALKRQRYLEDGLEQCKRLEGGLDNVLTAAGLRTTAPRPRREVGDLVIDARTAIDAMAARAATAGITLRLLAPASLPLKRDPAGIQLVLRNLLDNAIKYSPASSEVGVALTAHDGSASIVVSDAGRGLDNEERRRAFEPFWRGSDGASGGNGLGLHLVRTLVEAHGGEVAAASAGRDRGSVFTVTLPLAVTP